MGWLGGKTASARMSDRDQAKADEAAAENRRREERARQRAEDRRLKAFVRNHRSKDKP